MRPIRRTLWNLLIGIALIALVCLFGYKECHRADGTTRGYEIVEFKP